jgi:hypothetical protein
MILPRSPHLCENGGFQFYLQSKKQRKVGWVGGDSHVVLAKNSLVKKKCETVDSRDVTVCSFVAKVRGEVFAITQSRNRRKTSQ